MLRMVHQADESMHPAESESIVSTGNSTTTSIDLDTIDAQEVSDIKLWEDQVTSQRKDQIKSHK